jgi:hypothetical protein
MLPRRMSWRRLGLLVLLAVLGSCKPRPGRRHVERPGTSASVTLPPPVSATSTRPAEATASSASASPPASGAASVASAAPPARTGPPGDACRVTRGPIQLSFTGPVTLVADAAGGDPRIVFNRDGVPRPVLLPAAAKAGAPARDGKPADPKKGERLALVDPPERATWPACAAAGSSLFCLDGKGGIHRSGLGGEGAAVVAQARSGSPLSAAVIGGSHVVYAFLADRRTSEGATTIAFAALDDDLPVVLSEDGAGATFVTMATRGEEALAMYIDARRVLTPVHARVLRAAGKLGLGPDAVLFVGSGTDGRTPGAIAQGGSGNELALLPIDKDDHAFGMAAIRIEPQPRDDAATTWSLYPAALDRPAIAATQGGWPIRVLRSRPGAADPKGKHVLELGELDAAGVFKPLCAVAEGTSFTDLTITVDRAGALWIAYTDADGTWIEKRG